MTKYKDRQIYRGDCRNSSTAIYIAELDKFVYVRVKFGDKFLESIGHSENDDGHDIFEVEAETDDKELSEALYSEELKELIEYESR